MTEVIELSPLARRFAEEYLIDFKAGPAALRAGYVSHLSGYHLLQDPRVDALIREGRRKVSERVNISIDNVLENMRVMTVVNVSDYFEEVPIMRDDLFGIPVPTGESYMRLKPLSAWSDEMRFALKSIKHGKYGPEIVLHDKKATNELIGNYYGIFKQKHEHTGADGGPLVMVTKDMDPKQAAEAYASTLQGSTT